MAAVPEAGERCHCYLLDLYISKLPRKAIETDLFYVRPLENVQLESQTWYTCVPVGRNKLYKMVNDMCTLAGILGRTNHIASEQQELLSYTMLVFQRKSLKSELDIVLWNVYECSEKQQNAVSRVLSAPKETSFNVEMMNYNEHCNSLICSSHELP